MFQDSTRLTGLRFPALVGFILVAPFVILEARHTALSASNASGVFVLFALLWALPTLAVAVGATLLRDVAEKTVRLRLAGFTLRSAAIVLLLVVWIAVLRDQLPCFLGIPNCD